MIKQHIYCFSLIYIRLCNILWGSEIVIFFRNSTISNYFARYKAYIIWWISFSFHLYYLLLLVQELLLIFEAFSLEINIFTSSPSDGCNGNIVLSKALIINSWPLYGAYALLTLFSSLSSFDLILELLSNSTVLFNSLL